MSKEPTPLHNEEMEHTMLKRIRNLFKDQDLPSAASITEVDAMRTRIRELEAELARRSSPVGESAGEQLFSNLPAFPALPARRDVDAGSNSSSSEIVPWIFVIGILINMLSSLVIGFRQGDWQFFVRAGAMLIYEGVALYSVRLTRRGKKEQAILSILVGLSTIIFLTSALITGLGWLLAFIEIALVFVVAYQTLPAKSKARIIQISFLVALATLLVDLLSMPYRVAAPLAFQISLLVFSGIVILANVTLLVHIYRLNLTSRYVVALGFVALLSVTAFITLRSAISQQETVASVVNVAGRQRMLSQRISRYALLLAISQDPDERAALRKTLTADVDLFEASHNALVNGGSVSGFGGSEAIILPGNPTPQIRTMYFDAPMNLDQGVKKFISEARQLLAAPDGELNTKNTHLQYLLTAAASDLISNLNAVTSQYQDESDLTVTRLQVLEIIVLLVTLLTLAIEALFIFRPITRQVEQQTQELQQSLQLLERKNLESQNRALALSTSTEVSRRISTILDLKQLVAEVVQEVQAAFHYYHVHIYLLDEEGQNLVMAGGTGSAGERMLKNNHKIPAGKGLVGRAAEKGQPVLVADTSIDPDWLSNPLLPETRSEIAIPVSAADRVLGVLDVQHNLAGGLGQSDVDLLQSIANQVAIAIQNARSYDTAFKAAEKEAMINAIGQKIQNASTIESVLQIAARELSLATGAKRASIQLSVQDEDRLEASQ